MRTVLARLGHPGPAGSSGAPDGDPKLAEEAHARCTGKPDAAMGLALLLLASSERGSNLLGIGASRDAGGSMRSTIAGTIIMNRRQFLTGMGGLATIGMGAKLVVDWNERSLCAQVFIAQAASYRGRSRVDHRGRSRMSWAFPQRGRGGGRCS